jgi:hypothetical protein
MVLIEGLELRLFCDASQISETILANTLPTAISDQATLKGNVIVQMSNNSGIAQKFKGTIDIDAVPATDLNLSGLNLSGGTVLRSQALGISLKSGAIKTFKVPISSAPGRLTDGVNTIFAVLTDPTAATSQSAAGPTLLVHAPIVSLSETEKITKLPLSTKVGATLKAVDHVTITNSGSDPFSGSLTIALVASPNDTVVGAAAVSTVVKKLTIPSGRSVTVALNFRTESGLGGGVYDLISAVTQPNQTVTSSNPATAPVLTIAAPITTPLFVDTINSASELYAPDANDASAQHINQLDLQMSIQNNGLNSIGTDTFTLFASTKPTLDASAVKEESLPLTLDIYSLSNYPLQVDFGIPDNGPDNGTATSYYIFVQVADTAGDVTQASYSTPISFAGPISG